MVAAPWLKAGVDRAGSAGGERIPNERRKKSEWEASKTEVGQVGQVRQVSKGMTQNRSECEVNTG